MTKTMIEKFRKCSNTRISEIPLDSPCNKCGGQVTFLIRFSIWDLSPTASFSRRCFRSSAQDAKIHCLGFMLAVQCSERMYECFCCSSDVKQVEDLLRGEDWVDQTNKKSVTVTLTDEGPRFRNSAVGNATTTKVGLCPRCKGDIALVGNRYLCVGRENNEGILDVAPLDSPISTPGCGVSIAKQTLGHAFSVEEIQSILTKGRSPFVWFVSKSGRKFMASMVLKGDGSVEFEFPEKNKSQSQ